MGSVLINTLRSAGSGFGRAGLCLALWLLCLPVISAHGERFSIKQYGVPDGLGSSFIQNIFQDSQGFLWVCTRDGLSRFDGSKFTTYKTADGLPNPTINSILENADGTFWVATNGGGVCKFDPAGKRRSARGEKSGALFATYQIGHTEKSNRVNIVYRNASGVIYVGTDEGLFRLEQTPEGERFQSVAIRHADTATLLQPGIRDILQDGHGDLWLAAPGSALYRIAADGRTRRYTTADHPAFRLVQSLLQDQEGMIWMGSSTGVCRLATHPGSDQLGIRFYTKKDGLIDDWVDQVIQTRDGHLWFGTRGGITEFDGSSFVNARIN